MARSLRQNLLTLQVCLLLCWQATHAETVENGKFGGLTTSGRDCSPYGLDGGKGPINPAFSINFPDNDPLNHCTGVINYYYYFKILVFVPQLETSLALRAVKAYAEVLWNINAHFTAKSIDTLAKLKENPARRRPAEFGTIRNRNIAIAFGLTRISAYLVPNSAGDAQIILDSLLYTTTIDSTSTATDITTAEGIGNACAQELIASLKDDGWNSEGDLSPENPFPYFDYTNYQAVNSIYEVTDPSRWQPIIESNQMGYFLAQLPSTMQLQSDSIKFWGVSKAFVKAKLRFKGGPGWTPDMTKKNLRYMVRNATDTINLSAGLTETQKLLAEFFDAKIMSFGGFERLFAYQNDWCHDQWIEYEQMSAAFYDATVITWKHKARVDAIRPISAIRWLVSQGLLPQESDAWAGPGKGTATIPTNTFQSYLRTMPHTEWPSGTSCICQVFTEWTKLYNNGSDTFDLQLKWYPGCSSVEPGTTPREELEYSFTSLDDMNAICSQTRRWAGVHFEASVREAPEICSGIAAQGFAKVQRLKSGKL